VNIQNNIYFLSNFINYMFVSLQVCYEVELLHWVNWERWVMDTNLMGPSVHYGNLWGSYFWKSISLFWKDG